jgi:hypothetical protein
MEGDAERLVLDQQIGGGRGKAVHPLARLIEPARRGERDEAAVGQAKLEPVRAGNGQAAAGQVALEVADRAAADEREPTVEPLAETAEKVRQIGRDPDRVRRLGQIDQRTVEIEEESHPVQRFGRRRKGCEKHAGALAKRGRLLKGLTRRACPDHPQVCPALARLAAAKAGTRQP